MIGLMALDADEGVAAHCDVGPAKNVKMIAQNADGTVARLQCFTGKILEFGHSNAVRGVATQFQCYTYKDC